MWKLEVFKNIHTKNKKCNKKSLHILNAIKKKKKHNLMNIKEEKKFQKKEK